MQYRKNNKKQVNIDLNLDEYELLNELLKLTGKTKVEVFRLGIEQLKKDTNK